MARLSKFDKAIKAQMQGLQGEPSAKVWAGIRAATPAKGGGLNPWILRSAAALLLIGVLGATAWYIGRGEGMEESEIVQEQGLDQGEVQQPAPIAEPSLLVQDDSAEEPAEEVERDEERDDRNEKVAPSTKPKTQPTTKYLSPNPALEQQGIVQQEKTPAPRSMQELPAPKMEMPLEEPVIEEVIVEEDDQMQEMKPIQVPDPVQGAQPETSRSTRKQYALSDLKDISREDVRKKSGEILGNFALNASEALGFDTEITTESIDENHEKKAFSTQIGPFSFKRVRNIEK